MARWGWIMAAATLAQVTPVLGQVRPDAGTLQEQPRLIPSLPPPGGPRLAIPPVTPAPAPAASVRITPAAFRFEGNTLYAEAELQPLLAARVGQPTDLAGLQDAARVVRDFYQDRGYLLTDAFVPEQALPREGGTVTIRIVEARVGQVTVRREGAAGARAEAIVRRALVPGAHASEYALDRPVLLARDLAGHDAVATIEPGARTGEVDVVVTVSAEPRRHEFSVGADNHGVRAAGQLRAFAAVDSTNVSGGGDALSARVQLSEITDTRLYRVAYTAPVGEAGTRASIAVARSEYALGGAFEALGARGTADVAGVTLMHPFVRGRLHSIYGVAAVESKSLEDRVAVAPAARRRIVLARVGIAGNSVDEAMGTAAFTSYAASLAHGRLRMDAVSAAADAAPGGPGTGGDFTKASLELQRTQFLSPRASLFASLQAQHAFGNLTSAEKMTLGGATGVRAYPAGEAAGDSGVLFTFEARYQLATAPLPVTVGWFYDAGRVRLVQEPFAPGRNSRSLHGTGLSLQAGTPGRFIAAAALAWRVGSERPSGGEPDRLPRFWLTTQGWF